MDRQGTHGTLGLVTNYRHLWTDFCCRRPLWAKNPGFSPLVAILKQRRSIAFLMASLGSWRYEDKLRQCQVASIKVAELEATTGLAPCRFTGTVPLACRVFFFFFSFWRTLSEASRAQETRLDAPAVRQSLPC